MTNLKLKQAVDYYKSGDRQTAKSLLIELVQEDPDSANAWYILALCEDQLDRKEQYLRKVLEINPEHQKAKQVLTKMEISSSEDEIAVSISPSKRSDGSRYIILSLVFLLCISVLWLYIEVGRVKIPVPITTLNSRVETNNKKISSLTTDISSMASELTYVGALARNADRYSHSHGYSDIRLKRNISPLENVLESITKLRGVSFFLVFRRRISR